MFRSFLAIALIVFTNSVASAQATLWRDIDEKPMLAAAAARGSNVNANRTVVPQRYRTLELDRAALASALAAVPLEFSGPMEISSTEIELPLPNGGFGRFNVQESPVMEPKLAAKFPEIKTYVAQGIDDPGASARFDITPQGFHAMILSPRGQVFIDPYWRDSAQTYVAYAKRDFIADKPFSCLVRPNESKAKRKSATPTPERPTGANLRKYRLALACTGEYATAVCKPNAPTLNATLGAMITSVNRVNTVYERDFAIRLILIGNTDLLVYLNGSTDPYTNEDGETMLGQNQGNLNNVIGSTNYDIGHVFSTGGGGIAGLGVVCTSSKAQGVTGTSNPIGDPYDIDYVAHEMGHQFGGDHTFNSNVSNCGGGNRNAPTAYEVGSGITIMAYAGICGNTDLAPHSDDYFHTGSYTDIDNYTGSGSGAGCAVSVATGNTPPVLGALTSFTIPANTPFALTGSATDADGDTVTYDWEEYDVGTAQSTQNPSSSVTSGPIFRSFEPTLSPTRYFPSLTYILNNANVPPATITIDGNPYATGEVLPSVGRTMNFRLTARDNRAGGGGSNWASTTVTSVSTGAAFAVTSPNTAATFVGGSQQTVTWNVAGTTGNGINCANVKISLSTDGGYTFPTVLASSTPNNGSATVTLPQIATTQGRVKIEGVGNIFFDISDANFTITSANNAPILNVTGSISVSRGMPTPTVANVATVSDPNGDALSVSVSNLPYRAAVTPSISGNNIMLSALVDCRLTTTLSSRIYPITLTVTDSQGAMTSATVNLIVTPNASPTLGPYPNISVAPNSSATSTPAAAAADANGNLQAAPYTIAPTTLPGGGTISIDQNSGVVTVTTTPSSTLNSTTAVRVTAVDSCGATVVSSFNVSIVSTTPFPQAGNASAPSGEGCAPANGAVDPGETVTVNFPITNAGGGSTTNLIATLQNSGGVTPITTTQNYGAIASNGSATKPFQFTANGTCGSTITATLQLQDGATNYGTVSYAIRLGVPTASPVLFQNFDGVSAPALPAGWTATVASGTMAPWATSTTTPDSLPNSVFANTVTTPSDNRLTSPSIAIPSASPQLSFRHRWNLESGYDGGILEISINGGAFTEIVAAGGSFASGGYNGSISASDGSAIAGANAWTGSANSAYTTTLVNLPPTAAGQNVQFRWRLVCDQGVGGTTYVWRIDSISILSNPYVCSSCSTAPAITSAPPPSTAIVGSPYSYTFSATGVPAPTFSLTSGSLPPGLTLSAAGVLSGTPTSAGTGNFPNIAVTASNGNAPDAQQTFSLSVVTRADNYIASYGLSGADAGLLVDYDGDGLTNLMEYALQLNPTIPSRSGLPTVVLKEYAGTKYLSITFTRASVATDLSYIVQASGDLVNWSDLASSIAGGPMSGAGYISETGSAPTLTDEVRDTVPFDGNARQRFLRLKITSP